MSVKSLKSLVAASAFALTALTAPAAQASFSATFQNVTFNFNVVDSNTFTFEIVNALNANGDWAGISALAGFDFKDIGVDFGVYGATETYLGNTVVGTNQQINAGLCGNGQPPGSVCFGGGTYPGLNLALTNDMVFTIDITGGGTLSIASTGPHLQIAFMDAQGDGDKQGTLYSQNIASSSSSSSSSSSGSGDLPEPGTGALVLLGLSLLGMSFVARRKAPRT